MRLAQPQPQPSPGTLITEIQTLTSHSQQLTSYDLGRYGCLSGSLTCLQEVMINEDQPTLHPPPNPHPTSTSPTASLIPSQILIPTYLPHQPHKLRTQITNHQRTRRISTQSEKKKAKRKSGRGRDLLRSRWEARSGVSDEGRSEDGIRGGCQGGQLGSET